MVRTPCQEEMLDWKKTETMKFKTKTNYSLFLFATYEQPVFKLIFFEANITCSSAAI